MFVGYAIGVLWGKATYLLFIVKINLITFNPAGAKVGNFQGNRVNTMAVDGPNLASTIPHQQYWRPGRK